MAAAIETHNLTKDYGSVRALDGLSLTVQPGEIFGFLGPNGAGKSTTIRLLLDLIRPTSGHARVLGFDCQQQSQETRALIGYLPGDVRLYTDLTARQNVDYFSQLRARPIDQQYVGRLADRLQLSLDHHVGTLSKGNRQKLGLLLALLDRPRLLLLDEPTSGLDPLMQIVVWDLLREIAAEGVTVFFSSHVLNEVEQICERVGILRLGKLVAVEPIADLKGRMLRRIEVTFATAPPAGAIQVPELREIQRWQDTVTFEIAGHVDEAIKAIAAWPVVDLRTEQPSLEEILIAYYQDAGS